MTSSPKIAIVGLGAVGGCVASALLPHFQLMLCAPRRFSELAVTCNGHTVTSPVNVLTNPTDARPVDWVLLATKAHQTSAASAWLSQLCSPDTRIVVLQNGVEHIERVAPYAAPKAIVPAIVDVGARRITPGVIECWRRLTITMPNTDNGRAAATLLSTATIAAQACTDFTTVAWRKLCVNVVSGAIPTLTDQPRKIFRAPAIADLVRAIVAECAAVGRAEGARLPDGIEDDIAQQMASGQGDAITSMLADRRAGRTLESDARNGAVVRIGKRYEIETPVNRTIATLLANLSSPK